MKVAVVYSQDHRHTPRSTLFNDCLAYTDCACVQGQVYIYIYTAVAYMAQ